MINLGLKPSFEKKNREIAIVNIVYIFNASRGSYKTKRINMTSPKTLTPKQVASMPAVRLQLHQLKQHHLFLRNLLLDGLS